MAVEVENLAKYYGSLRALDGISFSAQRGDVLGFLGPNGAGKTTAMRLITGFLTPDRGSATVAGHPLATESLAARRKIGYLPENAPSYGEMTVLGFLEFIAAARAVDDPRQAIDWVLAQTNLDQVVHQTIDTLSKGFKRRVGLAQALIHDPEVLILDEPTDGLDPNQKALIHDLIDRLARDKCIILSTHILDEVERVCNRAMIISAGKILVDSTPDELIRRAPRHNVIRLSLRQEAPDVFVRIKNQDWCAQLIPLSPTSADICPVNGENHLTDLLELTRDAEVSSVQLQEGRLDDLFREITGGVAA